MRTVGLGKTSEQWQEVQTRNEDLEKILSESQKEKGELKDRVAKLERSLRQYRNQNSAIELRASMSRIEEMKKEYKS
ncbi:hypothetical protein Godav_011367 [Gossypium davidsonii]|uniref:Uncharacterized protein n=1 Tax=Gossypium davidsonii TaxID=34287 RepID=A0A7J8RAG8_GOSDV|nr:hypothetical protein [Gossypium davidsonii]